MDEELEEVLKEENGLRVAGEVLKKTICQVNKELGRKETEIHKLKMKLAELREGKALDHSSKSATRVSKTVAKFMGGKDAVAILPEEIWTMILELVSSPCDLWSCTNTCQLFQNILKNWRSRWLLEQALPFLYRHLPGNMLLKCRTISKSWNAGVDHFLEEHPSLRPHPGPGGNDPRKLEFVNPIKEKAIYHGNKFIFSENSPNLEDTHLPSTPGRNPFIGRHVMLHMGLIDDDDDEDDWDESFVDKLYTLLNTFGKEIWYLTIFFPEISHPEWQPKLLQLVTVDLFQLVPNLRKLRMDHTQYKITNRYRPTPITLPAAPKLETLEADFGRYTQPDPLLDAILKRYHPQLGRLHLAIHFWETVHLLDWTNLRELHLSGIQFKEQFETLERTNMPRLSKLGFKFKNLSRLGLSFDILLETINRVSSTTQLNTLRLEGELERLCYGELVSSNYAPSTLKTLEMDHYWGAKIPSYGFLVRYFPFLETLHLFLRDGMNRNEYSLSSEIALRPKTDYEEWAKGAASERKDELLQVNKFMYGGQMYRSNIWVMLPQLKVFSFQWDIYTRHEYEEYSRKNVQSNVTN